MNRTQRVVAGAFTGAIAATFVLTGCSSDDGGDTKGSESDSAAKATLDAAATATEQLTGAHIDLTIDGQLQSVNATKVVADVETKPKVEGKGTTTLNMGGSVVEAPFVYVDGRLYANVGGKGFQDYGDGRSIYDVSKVLDSSSGVPSLLRNMQDAQKAGDETIDGVKTTEITGTVTGKDLSGLASMPSEGDLAEKTFDATVFVTDDGKNEVARVVVTPAEDVTLTVNISDWGKTVDVSKPADVEAPTAKPAPPKSGEPTRDPVN